MAEESTIFPQQEKEITILDGDLQDVVQIENVRKQAEQKINEISGTVFRLNKDLDALYAIETQKKQELEQKRQDLVRRYNLDANKDWKVDLASKKIIYTK